MTGLSVCGDSNGNDLSDFTECLIQCIFIRVEAQIANEQGSRRFGDFISVFLRTATSRGIILLSLLSHVNVDRSTIDFSALEFKSSLGLLGGLKVDISETLGTTSLTIGDDAGRDDTANGLEFLGEPFLVDVPGEITDKDTYGAGRFRFGAFDGGFGFGGGVLAFLGGRGCGGRFL